MQLLDCASAPSADAPADASHGGRLADLLAFDVHWAPGEDAADGGATLPMAETLCFATRCNGAVVRVHVSCTGTRPTAPVVGVQPPMPRIGAIVERAFANGTDSVADVIRNQIWPVLRLADEDEQDE